MDKTGSRLYSRFIQTLNGDQYVFRVSIDKTYHYYVIQTLLNGELVQSANFYTDSALLALREVNRRVRDSSLNLIRE